MEFLFACSWIGPFFQRTGDGHFRCLAEGCRLTQNRLMVKFP